MSRTPFDNLPAAQQAGILCTQGDFQRFCAEKRKLPWSYASEAIAAETVRRYCNIESRKDLNTDRTARAHFAILRAEFDAWRGKISKPR